MKKLIIAEKPSLAKNIGAAIGRMSKNDGYFENDDYIITWAFGHLFSLVDLEEYRNDLTPDEDTHWDIADLPFCPNEFRFELRKDKKNGKIDAGVRSQFKTICDLLKRKDVDGVINAGDADREGEIIVRIILQEANNTKPVYRLWMPDQTPETIRKELGKAESDSEYNGLADEGYARTYIDWLYGINLTRFASVKSNTLLRVGRVTTPIVNAIYERDKAIKDFVPEKYIGIESKCHSHDKDFTLKSSKTFHPDERVAAEDLCNKYNAAATKVESIETKKSELRAGKLFSLSKLQGFTGKKFGISPQETLDLVQKLYEAGLVTYPRTNSEYLATAEKGRIQTLISKYSDAGYKVAFKEPKTIFDDSKIESHSALTPTGKLVDDEKLDEKEGKIYNAIKNRFLAVFCSEPCIANKTTVRIGNGIETFELKGTVVQQPGWTQYEEPDSSNTVLPDFVEGETIAVNFAPVDKTTKPPVHYTTETLLNFLKNPFRAEIENAENDDEEYRAMLSGAELGTEATRAGLIEGAIKSGYIDLKKNSYYIAAKGVFYIEALTELGALMTKQKTVDLGVMLHAVYDGSMNIEEAVKKAFDEITALINKDAKLSLAANPDEQEICKCPKCGGSVIERGKGYFCTNKDCSVKLFKDNKYFKSIGAKMTRRVAVDLLTKGECKMKNLVSSKGKYDAVLKVSFDGEYPSYSLAFPKKVIAKCPMCGGDVVDKGRLYGCENKECRFALWKQNRFLEAMSAEISDKNAKEFIEKGESYYAKLHSAKKNKDFAATVKVDFSGQYPQFSLSFD